jgi:hypothetical protein
MPLTPRGKGNITYIKLSSIAPNMWNRVKSDSTVEQEKSETASSISDLLRAIEEGDVETVEPLIAKVCANTPWDLYPTLLLFAVSSRKLEMVKKVSEHLDLDKIDLFFINSAIGNAKKNSNSDIVAFLTTHYFKEDSGKQTLQKVDLEEGAVTVAHSQAGEIDGRHFANARELIVYTAIGLQNWDLLYHVIAEDTDCVISASYAIETWKHAASHRSLKLLRLLNELRKQDLAQISYRERIDYFLDSHATITSIRALILPIEEYPVRTEDDFTWALDRVMERKDREAIEHLLLYTDRIRPRLLQRWLNSAAKTADLLHGLLIRGIPLGSDVRGQSILAMINSDTYSLEKVKALFELPVSEDAPPSSQKMVIPSHDFAPIYQSHMIEAILAALRKGNRELVSFLYSVGTFDIDPADSKRICDAATEYAASHPESREILPARSLGARIKKGWRRSIRWLGSCLTKISRKLCSCFT